MDFIYGHPCQNIVVFAAKNNYRGNLECIKWVTLGGIITTLKRTIPVRANHGYFTLKIDRQFGGFDFSSNYLK